MATRTLFNFMIAKNSRRQFLKTAASASAALATADLDVLSAKERVEGVALMLTPDDRRDRIISTAVEEFRAALAGRNLRLEIFERIEEASANQECIVAACAASLSGKGWLETLGVKLPGKSEAISLARRKHNRRSILVAGGSDPRSVLYALLELADRIKLSADPIAALRSVQPTSEQAANSVRSIGRAFVSEVEDKPWFYDREMWPRYLTMLATNRFNRFSLTLGIGYDFLQDVRDAYFLFAYPFFLSVPGYDVRVRELPDAERDRNFDMLKFIGEKAAERGLEFQLGLWMHGYEWLNSPHPNYTISGLSRDNHAAYCRDALTALLRGCPTITGVTLRTHGESGVEEASYDFWRTVFQGAAACGRRVELDLHAKGIDQTMIDSALATGMPVKVAPKYWAEHHGMPYHQAEIRELERPKPGRGGSGLMKLSTGLRSFLRYGYGDLLKEPRPYGVLERIWPGTHRLLLWGDPLTGAAHARAFRFCGCVGVELMEPLTFKGRRASGIAGDRCGYADKSLTPRWDWEKFEYTLRLWGRQLYNPNADPEIWRRYLQKSFGQGATAMEMAVANTTRILPIVTTAHGASAANNSYWLEMYTNQPIVSANRKHPYSDTPSPKVFGNVSPFDPQLFLRINEFASELLNNNRSGKYNPIEVAQWLEDYSDVAAKQLARASQLCPNTAEPEYRRMAMDVVIQIGLGRFFAAKFRSGVLYALYEQSSSRTALAEALRCYRQAREHWAKLAHAARDIYQTDVTVGELPHLRGHWLDRLPAIDADIQDMEKKLQETRSDADSKEHIETCVRQVLGRPRRITFGCKHTPASSFRSGQSLDLLFTFSEAPASAQLYYRHVNQGERWQTSEMRAEGKRFHGVIPAAYTDSPFPLQYYFQLKHPTNGTTLFPGLGPELIDQPYFVLGLRSPT
jgi:hypothetical protein